MFACGRGFCEGEAATSRRGERVELEAIVARCFPCIQCTMQWAWIMVVLEVKYVSCHVMKGYFAQTSDETCQRFISTA